MIRPVDRWRVTATITVVSPIAIRTGEDEPTSLVRSGAETAAAIQSIAQDVDGKPYIPGSAIKGLFRRLVASHDVNAAAAKALLGDLARKPDGANEAISWGGAAEFRNAFASQASGILTRGQTAIDRGSRTAAHGMLRQGNAIAPGSTFGLDVIIDRADEDTAKLLLDLLALVDGAGQTSEIGSGSGRIAVSDVQVRHWDRDTIAQWATNPVEDWQEKGKLRNWAASPPSPLGHTVDFPIKLAIDGYFLPGVAVERTRKDGRGSINSIPYTSDPTAGLEEGSMAVPELASTGFDGALRSQAERIYRTIIANPQEDWSVVIPPGPLEELFGSTRRKGLFTPTELKGSERQPLVAVNATAQDRIAGGAYGTGPVTRLAYESPELHGALSLTFEHRIDHARTGQPGEGTAKRALSPEAVGLLALTLRDLAEGDIPLGGGTRNGYGAVGRLTYGEGGDWRQLLRAIGAAWSGSVNTAEPAINGAVAAFLKLADKPMPGDAA